MNLAKYRAVNSAICIPTLVLMGLISASMLSPQAAPASEPVTKPAEPPKSPPTSTTEPKKSEAKSAEAKSAEAKSAEAKPAEAKPARPPVAEAKPAEAKPAEAKPAEAKPAEAKPAEAKPAEAKPARPPVAEAKSAESKTESKPAEPRLRFNFRFQRWVEVLEEVAKQAGLSLVLEAPPPGTFNYTDTREYTPTEAIDLLNGVLVTKGYTLVRRDKMLVLVDLSEGIPEGLIQRVTIDELSNRGKFEMVTVLFPLKGRVPDTVIEEIKPLLGPHGKAIPLASTGQLLLTDTAGIMKAISAVIDSMPIPLATPVPIARSLEPPTLAVYPIKTGDPQTTLKMLQAFLPAATIVLDPTTDQIHVSAGATQQAFVKTVLDQIQSNEPADKKPRLESYRIDETTAASLLKALAAIVPDATLSQDPKTSRLLAWAPPADQEKIQEFVEKMGGAAASDPTRQFEIHRLSKADPATTLVLLQEMFPAARIVLDKPSGSLVAIATAGDQKAIKTLLEQLQAEPAGAALRFESYLLHGLDPTSLVTNLQTLVPNAKVTLDKAAGKLVAFGTSADQEIIKAALEKLGRGTSPENTPLVVVYRLTKADPATLITTLQPLVPDAKLTIDPQTKNLVAVAVPVDQATLRQLLEQLQPEKPGPDTPELKAYPVTTADPAGTLKTLKTLYPNAPVSLDGKSERFLVTANAADQAAIKASLDQIQMPTPAETKARFESYLLQGIDPTALVANLQALAPNAKVTLDAKAGKLVVFATPAEHETVKGALEKLGRGTSPDNTPQLTLYRLTKADPATLVATLQPLVPEAKLTIDLPSKNLVVVAVPADQAMIKKLLEQLQPEKVEADKQPHLEVYPLYGADAATLTTHLQALAPNAKITADKTGKLIIWGTPSEHEALKTALEKLGRGQGVENTPQLEIYRLTKADPTTAMATLQSVAPEAKVTLDAQSKSLIALAVPADQKAIRTVLEQLQSDKPAADAPQLRFYPLAAAPSDGLMSVLKALAPKSQVTFDAVSRRLTVVASPEDHTTLKTAIEQIEQTLQSEEKHKLVTYAVSPTQQKRFQAVVATLTTELPGIKVMEATDPNELVIWAKPSPARRDRAIDRATSTRRTQRREVSTGGLSAQGGRSNRRPGRAQDAGSQRPDHRRRPHAATHHLGPTQGASSDPGGHGKTRRDPTRRRTAAPGTTRGRRVGRRCRGGKADGLSAARDRSGHGDEDAQRGPAHRSAADQRRHGRHDPGLGHALGTREDQRDPQATPGRGGGAEPFQAGRVSRRRRGPGGDRLGTEGIGSQGSGRGRRRHPQHRRHRSARRPRVDPDGDPAACPRTNRRKWLASSSPTPFKSAGRGARIYSLTSLRTMFPEVQVSVGAETDQLVVLARPNEHVAIKAAIEQLNQPDPPETARRLTLYTVEAAGPAAVSTAITTLTTMFPDATFTAGSESGQIIVWARPADHQNVAKAIQDLSQKEPPERARKIVMYAFKAASASAGTYMLTMLRSMYPEATFSIGSEPDKLVVLARPKDHALIKSTVEQLSQADPPETARRISVYSVEATGATTAAGVVATLTTMFPEAKLTAGLEPGQIIVWARPAEHTQIAQAVQDMSQKEPPEKARKIAVYALEASGATSTTGAMSTLTTMFPDAKFTAGLEPGQIIAWARPADHAQIAKTIEDLSKKEPPEKARKIVVYAFKATSPTAAYYTIAMLRSLFPEAQFSTGAEPDKLVALARPKDHEAIKATVEQLASADPPETARRITVYTLESSTATTAAGALTTLTTMFPEAKFTAGLESGQIIAWARPAEHAQIAQAVQDMSQKEPPEKARKIAVYALEASGATSTTGAMTTLTTMFPDAKFTAGLEPGQIIAWARPADHAQIAKTIEDLSEERAAGKGPQDRRVRLQSDQHDRRLLHHRHAAFPVPRGPVLDGCRTGQAGRAGAAQGPRGDQGHRRTIGQRRPARDGPPNQCLHAGIVRCHQCHRRDHDPDHDVPRSQTHGWSGAGPDHRLGTARRTLADRTSNPGHVQEGAAG